MAARQIAIVCKRELHLLHEEIHDKAIHVKGFPLKESQKSFLFRGMCSGPQAVPCRSGASGPRARASPSGSSATG